MSVVPTAPGDSPVEPVAPLTAYDIEKRAVELRKLKAEEEKIRQELATVKRPWLQQPPSVLAIVATIGSIAGLFVGFNKSVLDSQVAEAKRIQAENAITQTKKTQ